MHSYRIETNATGHSLISNKPGLMIKSFLSLVLSSFSWSSSRMDRNIITVMSGQIVDLFDRDFRELYAISRELNLFKEFSINNKRSTGTSVRVTVPTRPALPATSRFQVSLGDKGTLKVPAHKYHNPKYLLALGSLPDDISSAQDLINKMEESRKQFGAEANPPDEDNEMMESQAPPSSEKGDKGTKVSCVPLRKKRFTFSLKAKQKDKGKEAGEGDPGPSTTPKLTPPTGTTEDITEEPAAETPTSEKTKSKKEKRKKKTNKSQSDDQGMFNRLLIIDLKIIFMYILSA